MTLHIRTARVSYAGPDRLDVTRKSADDFGLAFAPSWKLLGPVLQARAAGELDDDAWRAGRVVSVVLLNLEGPWMWRAEVRR